MTNEVSGASLLRMTGFMAIGVGTIWALQIFAFGSPGDILPRLTWVLGAAGIAGAGAGAIFSAFTMREKLGAEA